MREDIFVRYLDFPNRSVKAATFPNDDGSFDIYVNTLYPESEQRRALEHELKHIRRGHFYSEAALEQKEAEADGLSLSPEPERREVPVFESPDALADWLLRQ